MKVGFVSPSSTPSLLVLLAALPHLPPANGASSGDKKPNIIVVQPDDFPFFNEWSAPPDPPNHADKPEWAVYPARNGIPNIERLREGGLQMLQAYTASSMCGTSRFSTITGRYPSRSGFGRYHHDLKDSRYMRLTSIPYTKLQDKPGQPKDCSENNLAVTFKNNGYATAMIGKWHLTLIDGDSYSYEDSVEDVKACGFDTVGGLYVENMQRDKREGWYDGNFAHNMEWLAHEAVEFIKESVEKKEPFLLYFNPTVPHHLVSVEKSLKEFSCRDTAAGRLPSDPVVKGMTDRPGGCDAYRKTIYSRAKEPDEYGAIWLDDSIGALLTVLEDADQLENTLFLFQEDHGTAARGKSSLYEGGVRIPQFIHYPAEIEAGMVFDAPVSTVDVAPTLMDYAGITPPYELDGRSWRSVVVGDNATQVEYWKDERCLYFELGYDRAVRCGCYKFLVISDLSKESTTRERGIQLGLSHDGMNVFDLCGDNGDEFVTSRDNNREVINEIDNEPDIAKALANKILCHVKRTQPGKENDFSECGDDYELSGDDIELSGDDIELSGDYITESIILDPSPSSQLVQSHLQPDIEFHQAMDSLERSVNFTEVL